MRRKTTEEFIEESKKIHGNIYDYSKVNYINAYTKVEIICKIHGSFFQRPDKHLIGQRCPICSKEKTSLGKEGFTKLAKNIHGDKYDYSKVNYINNKTKVEIICKIHGNFWQRVGDHLNNHGCPLCGDLVIKEKLSDSSEDFIIKAKKIHGDRYDYSKVNYYNNTTKVEIICKTHGNFWQIPSDHLRHHGCKKCYYAKILSNTEDFINKANIVHNNLYDYSKVNYINNITKIEIICKIHGSFWQIPYIHLQNHGCPVCNSSKGEMLIANYLEKHKISFIPQKRFDDCKNVNPLPFDFYLPNYNILIEFDGKQHFEVNEFFGGKENFIKQQINDNIKTNYSKENNISLIRIRYDEIDYVDKILTKYII